jgi:hypothetical protein
LALIAITALAIVGSWLVGSAPIQAQGDYPRVIAHGKADAVNGGLAQPLAVDNHGVIEGNTVYTFNASSAGANGAIGYGQGQPAPEWVAQVGEFAHITGTTATAVKASSGFLMRLSINTPAAGTVSVFDLASASCTGTPTTNTVAVVTVTSSTQPQPIAFDAHTLNGICVKASVAMDLTAVYQ